MRLTRPLLATTTLLLVFTLTPAGAASPSWQYPVIENYGKVQAVLQADMAPSPDRDYRVLMDLTKGAEKSGKVGDGLVHAARLVNLYALAGVPRDNLDLVAVIHGKATRGVLNDAQYKSEFGIKNPNTPLIDALTQAGVEVVVCGQALAHHGFSPESVNPNVSVALGAMTALEQYQHDGYVLLP